ncbi:MAG: hypothetical protein WC284_03695 [Candidimonas sp.]
MIRPERVAHLVAERAQRQQGQAMAEGIVVLVALLSMWVAVSWVGRLQDMALQADHAGRHGAFSLTRQSVDGLRPSDVLSPYLHVERHRWHDTAGRVLQAHDRFGASWTVDRERQVGTPGQIGRDQVHAARLRRDWHAHDDGIYRSRVGVSPWVDQPPASGVVWWRFSQAYPTVARSTSIVAGVGHASGDRHAQAVMGGSGLAWVDHARVSRHLSESVTEVMHAVDQPWRRPVPASDWLASWVDLVPDRHVAPALPPVAGGRP